MVETKDETELIQSVLEGNPDDFNPLVERYQGPVYTWVVGRVGRFSVAEEITQEVFVQAYLHLHQLKDPGKFPQWLRAIATNAVRTWLRKKEKRQPPADASQFDLVAGGGGPPDRDEFEGEVAKILTSLSDRLRIPVMLCYLEDIPQASAARFLGIREGTLRKRLHDAKVRLQREIVKLAERTCEEHRLPSDFAARCICKCRRSKEVREKEERREKMPAKKGSCGCGCSTGKKGSKTKAKRKPVK